MADWNTLKPLKTHSQILTFVIICLLGFSFFTPKHFLRNFSTNNINYVKVKANKGASIRDVPSITGNLLDVAPKNAKLKIIDKNIQQDVIENKSGTWSKVDYNGQIGFVWGNLIE